MGRQLNLFEDSFPKKETIVQVKYDGSAWCLQIDRSNEVVKAGLKSAEKAFIYAQRNG